MAIELSGIDNENDFFPSAFLTSALEEEIRGALARWRAEANDDTATSPVQRLASVGSEHQRGLARLRGASNGTARETYRRLQQSAVRALGYEPHRKTALLATGRLAPLLARVADKNGRERLWILEAPFISGADEAADPLSLNFAADQFADGDRDDAELDEPIEAILTDGVFNVDDAPRFVIVASAAQLVLVDRNKWPTRSALRFDLADIFSRANTNTLQAMTCFLAREALAPEHGAPLSERLEEEAQRHANAVTTSLKRTVRDAIELLGNEVLAVTDGKYPIGKRKGVWIDGKDLSLECLRFMYRLLFLFYAEANPRLGIMPMSDPAYRSGYSLEALRGLEAVRLRTPEEREGHFIWESVQRVLGLLYRGLDRGEHSAQRLFNLPRVRVSLLDPDSTPILSSIKLRNAAMQEIIRKLSLKQDRAGAGRISYAQLGIGQLGAVYETLISFTGTVADVDLIELIPQTGRGNDEADAESESDAVDAGSDEELAAYDDTDQDEAPEENAEARHNRRDPVDKLAPTYFVAKSRAREFKPEQIVYDGADPRIYKKGTFLYRLAGRDRQKSASYYTPEPLARLLVKHALMERCSDLGADELLELKILEPAMGSAAFLVETTNQVADLYLEKKQQEVGQRIPQDLYFLERQRVRAYIADRNCFGVDLNPIAVELGQISLWLNSLHSSEFTPWFGDQLHAGNSLLGARRAAFDARLLRTTRVSDRWLRAKPEEIGWNSKRPENHVWQFLLPAEDMAKFERDRSITPFARAEQEKIAAWRESGFYDPFTEDEVNLLLRLSAAADELFEAVADDLKRTRAECNDEITIWPNRVMAGVRGTDYLAKRARMRILHGDEHVSNSLPYQRLKTAMDAWCALWLWPLDQTDKLPKRKQFLLGLTTILIGGMTNTGDVVVPDEADISEGQGDLLERLTEADKVAATLPSRARQTAIFQSTDIDALISTTPWLRVAREVAARERFAHFDLVFADVLRDRKGFDLVVGNPPWARPTWNEGLALAELDPTHLNRTATQARAILPQALAKIGEESAFLRMFVSARGAMAITRSLAMNPYAGGGANNLYRCFVDLAFRLLSPAGIAALIHQDGHLIDPKSGSFRRHWYGRIAKHFDHSNKITSKNFSEVVDHVRFSLNIYRGTPGPIGFDHFTMAFLASQVDESYSHDGQGQIPAIKTSNGTWDTRPHRARLLRITREELGILHALAEDADVPLEETRLIAPFSTDMLDVYRRLSRLPKLRDGASTSVEWQMSSCWNETVDQQHRIIEKRTAFRAAGEMVLQGPMFYVANPLYKEPQAAGRTSADYDVLDLPDLPDAFLPRTNYGPGAEADLFRSGLPKLDWDASQSHNSKYRLAFRKRINLNSERSLVACLIPPPVSHLFTIESVAFRAEENALHAQVFFASLIADFLVKASGRSDFQSSAFEAMPWTLAPAAARHRALRLVALTAAYRGLWERHAPTLRPLPWSLDDQRLSEEGPHSIAPTWNRRSALRTEFARRLALVEIDVLVAQHLGLSLDQLLEIYRIYFPVLQENEAGTWYDQRGRIVWTSSKGLPRVGWMEDGRSISRKAWEKKLVELEGKPAELQVLECEVGDDTMPEGLRIITRRFYGPFTKCDRIEDYRRAWTHFMRLNEDATA